MTSSVFVDTNTLVYAFTAQDTAKQAMCFDWIDRLVAADLQACSLQVANEFSNVLLQKFKTYSPDEVFSLTERIFLLGDFSVTVATVRSAQSVRLQTGYRWWDCLLLASALELDCAYFLSEDMMPGHRIGPLTIVNPMDTPPQTVIERP